MNAFIECTMLSPVAQTITQKYDGSTNNLGNVLIDYKKSNKTISVNESNIKKKITKPKNKTTTI